MGGVEHQGAIERCFVTNSVKILLKILTDKAIIQRFVRSVLIRSILPLKSVLDDVDDAADETPVIHTGNTVRTGKERFDTLQLVFGKIKQGTHRTPPCLLHTLFSSP